jgi:hypothetical protein
LFSGTSPITYNSTTGAIGITGANLTEATSSVLTITGGTGALLSAASIQVKQASGSQNGFLSSTDWTTFNSKQNTITNPVTGTGTSGHVTFWNASSTITGDSNFFWDNTNKRLGVGTTSPSYSLEVRRTGVDSTIWGYNIAQFGDSQTNNNGLRIGTSVGTSGLTNLIAATSNDASQLAFWTFSGSSWGERMRITSAGNVGIGTTAPNQLLTLSNSRYPILGFNIGSINHGYVGSLDATGIILNSQQALPIFFYTTDLERMRITAGGNVGIGTTSPLAFSGYVTVQASSTSGAGLYAESTSGAIRVKMFADNGVAGSYIGTETNHYLDIFTNNTARARFTAGGNLLLGTTSDNGERLYVSGNIRATGTITANSDISLKKNLLKIENALEKVEQINGYTYEFKSDDSKRHAGVIAQEIQGVLPEIVNKGNDGILGVEYGNISALLIEAIKEQQTQINELKALLNK